MKKLYGVMIFSLAALLSACSNNGGGAAQQESSNNKNETIEQTNSTITESVNNGEEESQEEKEGWQSDYTAFLSDLFQEKKDSDHIFTFAVRDLDQNGTPELLVKKDGGDMTVYTWKDEVIKVGHHNFQSGTTRFLVSDRESCPGIFTYSVGGGYEWYGYVTIREDELVREDLWNYDFSGISKELGKKRKKVEETSSDKELIKESKKVYSKDQNLIFQMLNKKNLNDTKKGLSESGYKESDAWEEPVAFSKVDWTAYESKLGDEDYELLQRYMSVLTGDEKFAWLSEEWKGKGKKDHSEYVKREVTLKQMIAKLQSSKLEETKLRLVSLGFCDVFQKGSRDLILHMTNAGWLWVILHYEGDMLYGIFQSERCFEGVQTDGMFYGSSGAASGSYHRMEFREEKVFEYCLADKDWGVYHIGDQTVSEKEFFRWEKNHSSGDVPFYTPVRK